MEKKQCATQQTKWLIDLTIPWLREICSFLDTKSHLEFGATNKLLNFNLKKKETWPTALEVWFHPRGRLEDLNRNLPTNTTKLKALRKGYDICAMPFGGFSLYNKLQYLEIDGTLVNSSSAYFWATESFFSRKQLGSITTLVVFKYWSDAELLFPRGQAADEFKDLIRLKTVEINTRHINYECLRCFVSVASLENLAIPYVRCDQKDSLGFLEKSNLQQLILSDSGVLPLFGSQQSNHPNTLPKLRSVVCASSYQSYGLSWRTNATELTLRKPQMSFRILEDFPNLRVLDIRGCDFDNTCFDVLSHTPKHLETIYINKATQWRSVIDCLENDRLLLLSDGARTSKPVT
jgi:hypothetical protein